MIVDRAIHLQARKRQLVTSAFGENANRMMGRPGKEELGYLFGLKLPGAKEE